MSSSLRPLSPLEIREVAGAQTYEIGGPHPLPLPIDLEPLPELPCNEPPFPPELNPVPQ